MRNPMAISVLLFFVLCAGLSAAPQLGLQPESFISFRGNSTLHPYGSTSNAITLQLPIPAEAAILAQGVSKETVRKLILEKSVKRLELYLPVESLKSGEDGLDENTYKNLKKDEHPQIRFRLTSYETLNASRWPVQVQLKGTLLVAGVEKPIELDAWVDLQDSRIIVTGQKRLLMTDFGIEPPSMFFGAVKTDNEINVRFKMVLGVLRK